MTTCKKIFLLLLIFFLPHYLNAQLNKEQRIDSLKQSLLTAKDDTLKVKTLFRISRNIGASDSAQAAAYAYKSLQLSQKLNWQMGIGLSYFAIASLHNDLTDYSTGLELAKKAYDIFVKIKSDKNIGASLVTMGNSYSGTGIYAKAIECYFKSLKSFESINDTVNIANAYNNIGVCYYYLQQFDKAIEHYKKATDLCYIKNDIFGIGSGLDNIAITYLDEGEYDSANIYDLKAIPYFIKSNDMPGLSRIYGNRGNILMRLYDAKQAYDFFMRSLTISKKMNVTEGIGAIYGNIGDLYFEIANDSAAKFKIAPFMKMSKSKLLDSSKYYLVKGIELNRKAGDIEKIMVQDSMLARTEDKLGNYKEALAAFKDFTLYKDSIFNDENKQKIQALETQRLTEVKDAQIQVLNKQKALETSEIKRQTLIRNIIIVSVTAIALLAFIFIYLYNKRRKTKFDKQVKEVEMKALRAQMNPHFIFNSLHSINKYVIENDKSNASAYLSKFANLMRLILENSREQEISLEKDLHALELYMQLEALRFKNKFTYRIKTDDSIDAENTLIPPMLLQPFVENAILHGVQNNENGEIKISVHKQNEMICCVVEDNGNGRENIVMSGADEIKTHKSLATIIINERLNIINQLKKVKASVNIFDLKNADNKYGGRRIELLLPLELAF